MEAVQGAHRPTTPSSALSAERDLAYRIGEQVYDLRKERGWSQAELAERTPKTTQASISHVEGAERLPKLATLLRIAEALGARLVITFTTIDTAPETTP